MPLTSTCHHLVFQRHMSVCLLFLMLNGLILEVAIRLVNIDEIADHYLYKKGDRENNIDCCNSSNCSSRLVSGMVPVDLSVE